ncbi:MAG: glycosyltransferase family 2 protein [Planctomycetota bacterium]
MSAAAPDPPPERSATTAAPSLWLVMVNWNGGAMTRDALAAVGAGSRRPDGVIVVDNGSTDDSLALAGGGSPVPEIIRNPDNRGFAAAANQGIARALERGADLVFLLNNDARCEPETLARLEEASRRRPAAGLLAPKILREGEGPPRLWCAGVSVGFHPNLQDLRGFERPDDGRYDREEEVDALTGCGLLVRREVFEAIGLFDERFFVYVEDLDLSLRARDAGFACLHVPGAVLHHRAGASTGGGYGAWRKEMLAYNVVLLLRKRREVRLWAAFVVLDLLLWPALLVAGVVRGRARAVRAKGRGMLRALFGGARPAAPTRGAGEG